MTNNSAELERAAQLDFARSTRVVRDWFSDMSARPPLMGNVATLTRIFAVLGAITLPSRSGGDLYLDYSKWCYPRLVLNPGGNLATLVWLAWRYIHGYAVEYERVLVDVLAHEDLDTACDALFAFVSAAGTVPAHDPTLAADRSLPDQQVLLWPKEFARSDLLVRSRVRRLQRATDLGLGRTRRGVAASPFSYLDAGSLPVGDSESDPEFAQLLNDHAFVLRRNYLGYADAAAMVFAAVLDLLLVVGHFTAVMRRYLCPYEPRIGLDEGPGPVPSVSALRRFLPRFRTPLRYIRQAPASLLDGHFVACASRVPISPEYWLALEGDMVEWVNHVAPLAVTAAWGVLPGEPDSLQRAGPRCIPTHCGVIFPSERYTDAPHPDASVRARPGLKSFSARYRQVQAARDASPAPVSPGDRPRDRLVWTDLHRSDLGDPDPA